MKFLPSNVAPASGPICHVSWPSARSDAVGKMNVGPAPTDEPTAEERTRRGNCKNGVAEPGGPFTLAALIEMGDGIDDGHDGTDNSPRFSVSARLING